MSDVNKELNAMNVMFNTLNELEHEERVRVFEWIAKKFAFQGQPAGIPVEGPTNAERREAQPDDMNVLENLAEAFARAAPKFDAEKALIVATCLQHRSPGEDLTGREINRELQHLGHGVTNITSALGSLEKRKPKLIIQTRKEGRTKQAQKKYRVTVEGISAARRLIAGDRGGVA
jgi:hypothetical protein